MRLSKFILCGFFVPFVSGCYSNNATTVTSEVTNYEDISSYDYNYITGHNAAVSQFGQQYADLFVSLDNKRVVNYVSESSDSGYVDGYHKALEIIYSRTDTKCPHFH